tara:strand:- start:1024 stop:2208 length:1185 start_codon:yes stop_codon:yes gene_type:complete
MKFIKKEIIIAVVVLFGLAACKNKSEKKTESNVTDKEVAMVNVKSLLSEQDFDTIVDGKQVKLYWIESDSLKLAITNYGGRFVGLWTPDKNGKMTDVVVGMGTIKDFIDTTEPYFGATIGRVGNRIAKGTFSIDGVQYNTPKNNNGNTLHGGLKGFQNVVWDAEQPNKSTLVLKYHSPDMEEGFPGNLDVTVTYSITDQNTVKMEYDATTDKTTPVNLTNHAFFNLNGEGSGTILNHSLKIYATEYTPVDAGLIPSGTLDPVADTPFDFTDFHTIGERIETENEQLTNGTGYDHNYVLVENQSDDFNHAATVIGDTSGIVMDIYTQEPGLQFYSGNFMQGKNTFKSGAKDDYRTAIALETQHFPDAPNQPNFPSILFKPGESYHTVSKYSFSTK